ncbi:MAG: hypothetical protein ACLFWG_00040 [Longimicrobiales bacterium]
MKPLLIAGCPRSGTSLTAHAFRACGAWAGRTNSLCENVRLKQEILKPQLRRAGMDPIAVQSFADLESWNAEDLRERVLDILRREGWGGEGVWMFKDVKLVFAWRAWAEAFPEATWVTVWRPVEEITESFSRWPLARGTPGFDGERVIEEHHSRARELEDGVGHGHVGIEPVDLFLGDDADYREVCRRVGLEWDREEVRRVVDPSRFTIGARAGDGGDT